MLFLYSITCMPMQPTESCYERILRLQREGYGTTMIRQRLEKEGFPEALIETALQQLKAESARRRKGRGVRLMIAGGLILLTGFFITVYLFHQHHPFEAIMYGFTIAGTCLLLLGAYEILN